MDGHELAIQYRSHAGMPPAACITSGVGTLRARIALVDDTGVRARMTGAWLAQMGWPDVAVVEGALDSEKLMTGAEPKIWLGIDAADV